MEVQVCHPAPGVSPSPRCVTQLQVCHPAPGVSPSPRCVTQPQVCHPAPGVSPRYMGGCGGHSFHITPSHRVWQLVALLATLSHQGHTQATVALSYTPTTTTASTNITTTRERNPDCEGSLSMRPSGDIWGQVDSVYQVICYVTDQTSSSSLTAANLTFLRNMMNPLSHQVVDEYTISVDLTEAAPVRYMLACTDSSGDNKCLGVVRVGYQPLDVENFQCVSYNLEVLKCNWTLPYNPVQTASYKPYLISTLHTEGSQCSGDSGGVKDTCDDLTTCCFWRPPEYPAAEPFLRVLFQASNSLSNQTFNFTHLVRNYAVVLPDAAESVEAEAVAGSRELEVRWSLPSPMDAFPSAGGVVFRVDHRLHAHPDTWTTAATGKCKNSNLVSVEVKYWWQEYEVRVRLRSGAANFTLDDDGWWSDWSAVAVVTPPAEPEEAPAVGPGTFRIARNTPEYRDLTLSWRPLPTLLHNGPGFSYLVTATIYPGGASVATVNVTEPYATFTNLSTSLPYRLEVVSQNSEGRSQEGSWVVVGADNDLPDDPVLPVVVLHRQQQYELRWSSSDNTSTYTVYVCMDGLDTKLPCKADLYWLTVGGVTAINITLEEFNLTVVEDTGVRFAVSTERGTNVSSGMSWDTYSAVSSGVSWDTYSAVSSGVSWDTYSAVSSGVSWDTYSAVSSGMSWDRCSTPRAYTTAHRPPTLTSPVDVSETTARVQWTLECDDWAGVVEYLEVTYCLGHHNLSQDCHGESARESEVWSGMVEVRQLAAASQYTVWLRVSFRSGLSQWSSPQHFITDHRRGVAAWVIGVITIGAILSAVVLVFFCSYSRRKLQLLAIELKREPNLPIGLVNEAPKRSDRRPSAPVRLPRSVGSSASGLVLQVPSGGPQQAVEVARSGSVLDSERQEVPGGRGLSLGGGSLQPSGGKEQHLSDQATRTPAGSSTSPRKSGETVTSDLTVGYLSPVMATPEASTVVQHPGYVQVSQGDQHPGYVQVSQGDYHFEPPMNQSDSVGNLSSTLLITDAPTFGYVTVQQDNRAFVPQGIKDTVNLDGRDQMDSKMSELRRFWTENMTPGTGYVVASSPPLGTLNTTGLQNATSGVDAHDAGDHKPSKALETSSVLPKQSDNIRDRYVSLTFPEEDNDHLNLPPEASTPLMPVHINNKHDSGAKVTEKHSDYLELLLNDQHDAERKVTEKISDYLELWPNGNSKVQKRRYVDSSDTITLKVGLPQGYVGIQDPNFGISNQGSREVSVHRGEVTLGNKMDNINTAETLTNSMPKPSNLNSAGYVELGSFTSSSQLANPSQVMAMTVMNESHELLVNKGTTSTCGYIPHPLAEETPEWDITSATGPSLNAPGLNGAIRKPSLHTAESSGLGDLVKSENYPDKTVETTALVTGAGREARGSSRCVSEAPEDLPLGYSRVGSPT
ncbi:uncharacterized protein [Procambarus clarkii]|uniref:uncharacterized protein isoform X1 n=1 Tax=Procambarus clarkii TaxID=6728 RepID=UPI003741F67C